MKRESSDGNRIALVIGGCRGIGRAISQRLAEDGFDIAATARQAGPDSEELARQVAAAGRKFTLLAFDVRDREAVRRELERVFGDGGAPEVAVYNAGIARDNLMAFMSPREWDEVIETNVNGFYNTIQPLVFGMLAKKRGRIVAVSSASGQTGQAGQVNYSASKAALIGAVKALAREVGRKGVLVNAVAPGFIHTEMTREIPEERVLPLIPLNRAGEAAEVAGAVSFLCGPDSSYIHGQVIAVNGGLVI
ncbi:3-oxoacyl-ACP reductase FabG [Victivallis vadensis]|jgi:short-chain dehydrogenase/reductase SDR|uniref:3-oxoacyl-ACP reductase FabG n=1 Tax=Victivallis vadensis TaxID=172901 RepID=A0A2U1B059_9BACT|nr:3-oxoacyl-ACP reductase FabG [Victivallis vadensis]NMD86671.1 3-oxoacyl-ACP reductase FabG [Victivallis vadensis]PVY42048.1 3-oxoacyl-[acyl-carrier protein] reductase [Victivallis vadensis]